MFLDKNSDIFHVSAQNIDCVYSLEPPGFLAEIREKNVYPCKPQFNCIKWGLCGSKLYRYIFVIKTLTIV